MSKYFNTKLELQTWKEKPTTHDAYTKLKYQSVSLFLHIEVV